MAYRVLTAAMLSCAGLLLAGCAGGPTGIGAPEATYTIPNQPQDVVFVPVIERSSDQGAVLRDSLAYTLDLESCKASLAQAAAKPMTGEAASFTNLRKICYQVTKGAPQKQIAIE